MQTTNITVVIIVFSTSCTLMISLKPGTQTQFNVTVLAVIACLSAFLLFSQPSIYIDGWLYAMSMTSVVCNVPVLSQNDWTYHHSVFTT